jgi:UDP-GlcNAc:undecaprenyl-phosphate/decaprenyl-phosphate GlcNAc-1-phosphate transferase
MTWLYLTAFFSALTLSLLLTPLSRILSIKTGRVAAPREDRWHNRPTPTLGGTAMFVAFMLPVLGLLAWGGGWSEARWGLLGGAVLMFGLGLLDDFKPVRPAVKLVGQAIAAALVVMAGDLIDFFPWDFANVVLTFLWLVGITNAINLLDNMDGLAGGIALIAAGFLGYFFWRAENPYLLAVALTLAGSVLGFLIFNFPPARTFMGDNGSLFLGFTLAALAVVHRPRASDVFSVMGVPILLFLLPILDTALVTVTRLLRGQSPVLGGTDHTSHRLIAFGLSERQAVLALYAVGLISGLVGAALEALNYSLSLALIPLLLIILAVLTAYLMKVKVAPGGGRWRRVIGARREKT